MLNFVPGETVVFRFRGVTVATYYADEKKMYFGQNAYEVNFLPEDAADFGLWCMQASIHMTTGRRPDRFLDVALF